MTGQLTSKVATVRPEDAAHYRRTCRYDGQRKISEANVRRLVHAMETRTFIQGTSTHFCALPDGTLFLVNGNHTMEAIVACGIPQVLNLVVIPVPDMDAVSSIYISLDQHKQRSWREALHSTGLDQRFPMAEPVMAALGMIMQGFKYSSSNIVANSSRPDRFTLMREHYEKPAEQAFQALAGAPNLNRRVCLRRAVLGVALETFRYQAPTAHEFWHGLAHDDGLARSDARKTLLQFLLENKITGPLENYRQSKACSLAWNAFYKGQGLTLLRPGATQKMLLLGTPWGTTGLGEAMPPTPRPEALPEVMDPGDARDLFETGVEVGPDGAKPKTFYKH